MKKQRIFVAIWNAVLFSVFMVFGKYKETLPNELAIWGIGSFVITAVVTLLCFTLFDFLKSNQAVKNFINIFEEENDFLDAVKYKYAHLSTKKFFLIVWLLLFLIWLPAYIALFPGTFGYDAPVQLAQITGGVTLTSHHPVFHTLLMSGIICLGNTLFHNYNAGLAIFSLLQGIFVAGSVAAAAAFLKKKRVPFGLILVSFLWVALNPSVQALTFNCTKDTLYGASLVYFVIAFWNWNDQCKTVAGKEKTRLITSVIIFGVLMCLLRNQGVYIVAVMILFSLIFHAKRLQTGLVLLAVIALSEVFFMTCTYGFHIQKGNMREMLALPMQQMAAAGVEEICQRDVNMSEEQYAALCQLIPEDAMLGYTPTTADPVKAYFNTDQFLQNKAEYIKLYIQLGVQNPSIYLEAFKNMVIPYWDMILNENRSLCFANTFQDLNTWGIGRFGYLSSYFSYLREQVECPFATFRFNLFNPGWCVWIMTIAFGVGFGYKRKNVLLGLFPLFLYFGTLLLGPVALLRYAYPLVLSMPLIVGSLVMKQEAAQ